MEGPGTHWVLMRTKSTADGTACPEEAAAIVAGILIVGWRVIRMRPDSDDELMLRGELLATTRVAMIVICIGVLIAGFGDVFGKTLFGCR